MVIFDGHSEAANRAHVNCAAAVVNSGGVLCKVIQYIQSGHPNHDVSWHRVSVDDIKQQNNEQGIQKVMTRKLFLKKVIN